MTPEGLEQLKEDEGFVPHAYQDHLSYWTIGHGILIDKRRGGGITEEESSYLLARRVEQREALLKFRISFWDDLSPARKDALVNMSYQLGVEGLLKFKNMLKHLGNREFDKAAEAALDSVWARQTPPRAHRIANQLRNGE